MNEGPVESLPQPALPERHQQQINVVSYHGQSQTFPDQVLQVERRTQKGLPATVHAELAPPAPRRRRGEGTAAADVHHAASDHRS